MKRTFIALSAIVALTAVGVIASGCGSATTTKTSSGSTNANSASAPKTATVVISHVIRGCHDWSANGATPSPNQTVKLAAGATMTITNNDVMPHTLIQAKGPAATIAAAKMDKIGAQSKVTFPSPGVYLLKTKVGEDYKPGVKTVGPDHKLVMKVVVS